MGLLMGSSTFYHLVRGDKGEVSHEDGVKEGLVHKDPEVDDIENPASHPNSNGGAHGSQAEHATAADKLNASMEAGEEAPDEHILDHLKQVVGKTAGALQGVGRWHIKKLKEMKSLPLHLKGMSPEVRLLLHPSLPLHIRRASRFALPSLPACINA